MRQEGEMFVQSTRIKGFDVSRISLGTVQLGLDYGISNSGGKPHREDAFKILDCAAKNGISVFDTAAAYGDAEEVIGAWKKQTEEKCPIIVTKALKLNHSSYETLLESLRKRIEESKKRLGVSQIPVLMLHHYEDFENDEKNIMRAFKELKASGDILLSGISLYSNHDYKKVAECGFDAVQIPMNIFDWKQIENGGINALNETGMMVFVRSVFLQGLVFKNPDELSNGMSFCRKPLEDFRGLCKEFGMTPASLALSFALSVPGVTSLVLGGETVRQVEENVELAKKVTELSSTQMERIHSFFSDIDNRVINPNLWGV